MARRSFSLMLAWRYLNPRRAMLSTVAFISVLGVMFGVLVLVVVMSVYSGLEREIKGRLLGFIPHIRLEYAPMGGMRMPVEDWRETAEEVEKVEGVVDAGAFVQDALLIDINGFRPVGSFRGIDTSVAEEVAGIEAMLDLENFPDSSADMGLDDRVVISSKIARSCAAGVGDKVRLLTLRNFEEVERVFQATEEPPVRERFADKLAEVQRLTKAEWKVRDAGSEIADEPLRVVYDELLSIYQADVREPEENIVLEAIDYLETNLQMDEANGSWTSSKEAPEQFLAIVAGLDETDVGKMDAETLKSMREVVLPKEAEVIGVYAASQMAMTPDVFVPLHLAQELAGLGDGVQGVGVRLDDPYEATPRAMAISEKLDQGWYPVTWQEEIRDFSQLIEQQRAMMYFALSFIILNSVFSTMAVMYTVTVQKRREIGVMKALGAAPGQIVRVFLYQGVILGAIGSATGVLLGLLVVHFREPLLGVLRGFGVDPFPASFVGFTVLPAHVNPVEVAIIGVMAFLLCATAAYLPAYFAAKSDAAKSLRNL